MDIEELKARLAIEKGNLDTEISQHPMLYFEVAEACVQANAERDACKEELTAIDASLDGNMRVVLAKKEEKVTEAMVKNAVQLAQKHVDAFDTYMQAKSKADLLAALKESFSSRGYMLRDLVSLVSVGFYESTSMGQHNIDKARYNKQREKLAEARTGKGRIVDVLIGVWLIVGQAIVGCLLISFYFWRKEHYVETLRNKLGNCTDAT